MKPLKYPLKSDIVDHDLESDISILSRTTAMSVIGTYSEGLVRVDVLKCLLGRAGLWNPRTSRLRAYSQQRNLSL